MQRKVLIAFLFFLFVPCLPANAALLYRLIFNH